MLTWFQQTIIDHDRLPLLVCFTAFIVTFVTTRVITRMIRSGRGPFKNNVSSGGLHVHHAIPGVILLATGAFTAIAVDLDSPWSIPAGLFVGVGTSLVLDEFALILHLEDVYWEDEGRISVEMVSLAVCCLGLLLVGANPFAVSKNEDATVAWLATIGILAVHAVCIVGCVLKGKYRMTLIGVLVPFVALTGTVRLARPGSRWAKRWYKPAKQARAVTRLAKHDQHWQSKVQRISDFVAGQPSTPQPNQPVGPPPP